MTSVTIDTFNGIVHMESGETLPVTHWFDADGCDCSAADATSLVCGPDCDGLWVTIEVFPDQPKPALN